MISDFRPVRREMAPNSEEDARRLPAKESPTVWAQEEFSKEHRPPVYNPEDYAASLRTWGRRGAGGVGAEEPGVPSPPRDYRYPGLTATPEGAEMSLKQFNGVSELLAKLKADLRMAFPSFVQEFVGDPLDGVTLLLELLRALQLRLAAQARCPPPVLRRAALDELACLHCVRLSMRCADAPRRLAATPPGLFTLAVCIMSNATKARVLALQLLTKACESPGNGHGAVSEALSTLRLRFGEPVRFRFLVGMVTSSGGCAELQAAGLGFLNTFLESAQSQQARMYIQAELDQAGFHADLLRKAMPTDAVAAAPISVELARWERNYVDVAALRTLSADAEGKTDALQDKVAQLERRVEVLLEEKESLLSMGQCLKARCCQLESEVATLRHPTKHLVDADADASPGEDEGISSSDQDDDNAHPSTASSPVGGTLPETSVDQEDDDEETTIDEVIEELRNIINDAESEEFAKEEAERVRREGDRRKPITSDYSSMEATPKITIQARGTPQSQSAVPATKSGNNKVVNYFKNHAEGRAFGGINVRITSDGSNTVGIANGVGSTLVEVVDAIETELAIVPARLLPQPPRKSRTVVHIGRRDTDPDVTAPFFDSDSPGHTTSEDDSDSLLSAARGRRSTSSPEHHAYRYQVTRPEASPKPTPVESVGVHRSDSLQATTGVDSHPRGRRGSFDGLFYVTAAPIEASPGRPTWEARRAQAKSLDRIDEGLDALGVDVVLCADRDKSRFSSGRGSSEDWSLEWTDSYVVTKTSTEGPRDATTRMQGKQNDTVVFRYGEYQSTRFPPATADSATRRYPPDGSSQPLYPNKPRPIEVNRTSPNKPRPAEIIRTSPNQPRATEIIRTSPNQPRATEIIRTSPNQPPYPNKPRPADVSRAVPNKPRAAEASRTPPNVSPNAFVIKRGHTNAGLYSGQHNIRDAPAQKMLAPKQRASLQDYGRNLAAPNRAIGAKVMDLPSGLY